MHVVTSNIQAQHQLEENAPLRILHTKETHQPSGAGSVGNHVQNGTQTGHLVVLSGHGPI